MNKEQRTFWGIALLAAGIVFLLRNYGIVPWNWRVFAQAWPFIFIFWGIAMLEAKETTKRLLFIAAFITLIGLLFAADTYRTPMMDPWERGGGMHRWYW